MDKKKWCKSCTKKASCRQLVLSRTTGIMMEFLLCRMPDGFPGCYFDDGHIHVFTTDRMGACVLKFEFLLCDLAVFPISLVWCWSS